MLRIIVEHSKGRGYLVDVECSVPVRYAGSNICASHVAVVDIVDDVLYDYRQE